MRHSLLRAILVIVTCLSVQAGSNSPGKPQRLVRLAILPCNNIEVTFKKFYPLLAYLQKETGLTVKAVIPNDFEEFADSVRSGRIDFALQDHHTYLELSRFFNKAELLSTLTLGGGTTQSGVVVVRRDSRLGRLEDLKGKTVLFGPKTSTSKWVAARMLFESNGIKIETDLKSYLHGGCCEDIAFSVYLKSVDAGVVCEHFLAEHEEKQEDLGVDAAKLMIIALTGSFPTRIFAAGSATPEDVVSKINRALLKLDLKNPEHAKIMLRGEIGGFERAHDADYDTLRKSVGTAGFE